MGEQDLETMRTDSFKINQGMKLTEERQKIKDALDIGCMKNEKY